MPADTLRRMAKLPINEVLATNLAYFMRRKRYTQASLAKKVGLAQRTIGNYLKPSLRATESISGKAPSAKLTEVDKIAEGLGVETWELLRPITPSERELYRQFEQSFDRLRQLAKDLPREDEQERDGEAEPMTTPQPYHG
ncbi:MAG: phage repressor protein [Variovorax sp.]|nr:phage repressor protein [Variovorax sp.]